MNRTVLSVFGAWVALISSSSVALACSVCVTAAANDPTTDAYNSSVLFLMATPYLVVGSVAGWLVYAYRRAATRGEQNEDVKPVHLAWNQKESGR